MKLVPNDTQKLRSQEEPTIDRHEHAEHRNQKSLCTQNCSHAHQTCPLKEPMLVGLVPMSRVALNFGTDIAMVPGSALAIAIAYGHQAVAQAMTDLEHCLQASHYLQKDAFGMPDPHNRI